MVDVTVTPPGTAHTRESSRLSGILANVVWIVGQLDDRGLDEMRNLPILELAKHIALVDRPADER